MSNYGWKRSGRGLLVMVALGLGGCGGDGEPPGGPRSIPVPKTTDEVQQAYDALGNDCDGFVYRTFRPIDPNSAGAPRVSDTPESDEGQLISLKRAEGWTQVVSLLDMGFKGVAQQLKSTSPEQAEQCSAIRKLFSPTSTKLPDGRIQREHLSLNLYGDSHERPESLPESGALPPSGAVPFRLKGYLEVWTSTREEETSAGTLEELKFEHFPLQIACSETMLGTFQYRTVSTTADVDRRLCRTNGQQPGSLLCLTETVSHRPGTECRFVALRARGTGDTGTEVVFSLGGTLTATGDASPDYALRVDRMTIEDGGEPLD